MTKLVEQIRNVFSYANIIIDDTGIKLCYTDKEWVNQTISVPDMELMRQILDMSSRVSITCNTKSITIHLNCNAFDRTSYGIYTALDKPKNIDLYEFLASIPVSIDLLRIRKAIRAGNAEEVINEVLSSKIKVDENIRVHSGRYNSICELAHKLPIELEYYPPENSENSGSVEMYIPESGMVFEAESFQIFKDLVNVSSQIDFEFHVPDKVLNVCFFA